MYLNQNSIGGEFLTTTKPKEYGVAEFISRFNILLKNVSKLQYIFVKGEVSNCNTSKGSIYFSLKEVIKSKGQEKTLTVQCYLSRNVVAKDEIKLKEGDEVLVAAKVEYWRSGSLMLNIYTVEQIGLGKYYIMFEQLKQKLSVKGYFDKSHKKPLPNYITKIGLVTSLDGAAIDDFKSTVKTRFNGVKIVIAEAIVQGPSAPPTIIRALEYLDNNFDLDVICICRGGGSYDQLSAFNNEDLAYAIFNAKTPIVSGIGHENDSLLSDFVADKRASTPTHAGELVSLVKEDLYKDLVSIKKELYDIINTSIEKYDTSLTSFKNALQLYKPEQILEHKLKEFEGIRSTLESMIENYLSNQRATLSEISEELSAYNPNTLLTIKENEVKNIRESLINILNNNILRHTNKLELIKRELHNKLQLFSKDIENKEKEVKQSLRNITDYTVSNIKSLEVTLDNSKALLEQLSVPKTLNRGFAAILTKNHTKHITSVIEVDENETYEIMLKDGSVISKLNIDKIIRSEI